MANQNVFYGRNVYNIYSIQKYSINNNKRTSRRRTEHEDLLIIIVLFHTIYIFLRTYVFVMWAIPVCCILLFFS